MAWLFPVFLFGAGAVALPILLHLLRRKPRQKIEFPSLRFLKAAEQQSATQQRLRRIIILTLRCAAIALLAAAFARPFIPKEHAFTGRATVLVVDNSFSMQAAGRWQTALDWAKSQLGNIKPGDRLGVLLTGPVPTWLAPVSDHTDDTLGKLSRLQPGFSTSRNEPALRLAAEVLAASPARERKLIFVGDHQNVSWSGTQFTKPLPAGVEAIFPPLPKVIAKQAALSKPVLSARENNLEGSVVIRNYTGAQTRTLRIFREKETTPLFEKQISLAENETRKEPVRFAFSAPPNQSVGLRFALDPDDLRADDEAYLVWNPIAQRSVLLDAPSDAAEADYLATAMRATASIESGFSPTPLPEGAWPPRGVVVLRNPASFAGANADRLFAFLREGGAALIFVDGSPAQTQWLATHCQLELRAVERSRDPLSARDWAMDHPLISALAAHDVRALLDWNFDRGWSLPTEAVEPLALWSEGSAAIGETQVGSGRLLLCGFNADRRASDWPLHSAFVPFVHRAISYLLNQASVTPQSALTVGASLSLPAEKGSWRVLFSPAGSAGREAETIAVTSPLKLTAPGLYEFNDGSKREKFAVNVAPEESDPTPWFDGQPWKDLTAPAQPRVRSAAQAPSLSALSASEAEAQSPLWWWCVAAAALFLLTELGLSNRTAR